MISLGGYTLLVLFCADRYHCAVNDILHGSINNIINSYVKFNTTEARVQTADLLCELLNIRDSRDLFLTNLSSEELNDSICFICTS